MFPNEPVYKKQNILSHCRFQTSPSLLYNFAYESQTLETNGKTQSPEKRNLNKLRNMHGETNSNGGKEREREREKEKKREKLENQIRNIVSKDPT